MKTFIIAVMTFILGGAAAKAQIQKPVKWSYAVKKVSASEAIVYVKADIDKGWHIYALEAPEGGPVKTTISFDADKAYQPEGKTTEPQPLTHFEQAFNMNVRYFENAVIFQQKIQLHAKSATIKGNIEFMVCSDRACLPPETTAFAIPVK